MKRLALAACSAVLVGCFTGRNTQTESVVTETASAREDESVRRTRRQAFAERLATEGIVLLKNDASALPLQSGQEVVLLGLPSYFPHRMGWGSGDMLAHEPVSYDKGLEAAGIRLEPTFAAFYRNELAKRLARGDYDRLNRDWAKWTSRFDEPAFGKDRSFEKGFLNFAAGVDPSLTCLVTIGRNSGEAQDLQEAPGSFRLHPEERQLLRAACTYFDKVVVLLNTCGVVDTSFIDELPVKGLVYTSLLGESSGKAVANVLAGRVSPSGKTVDTWAKRYRDYPTTDCFATMEVPYREGSFVGYRHFDNRAIEPRYPFGFGLSYTTFERTPGKATVAGGRVTIPVTVRNTGSHIGAEVMQVYLARDGRETRVEPVKSLVAFGKTKNLDPSESETLSLAFNFADAAIFDEASASWVLPAGRYRVLCGTSSAAADLTEVAAYDLKRTVVSKVANRFRPNAVQPHEPVPELPPSPFDATLMLQDVLAGTASLENLVAQMSDEELVSIVNGRIFGHGLSMIGGTGVGGVKSGRVPCEAGEFWSSERFGIPALTCADGPSGVRLANFNDPASKYNPIAARLVSWPCATALAQGWNVQAAETFGRMIAEEMAEADIDGWLAPGVNIHRNPLCGRNFEYFSEDPLVAGRMGAAVVRGVQTRADGTPSGRYATVKHFCTNNQEFHRDQELNLVNEKALREIYLKPFEIAVRESQPLAIMTSYNKLNGQFCSANEDLLTHVLREEWGFKGIVMTDWWTAADKCLHPAAGNDVAMPGVASEWDDLLDGVKSGKVGRGELQRSAVRILTLVVNRLKNGE